ncbi:semialdehyde dehydrogenase [Deinococcus aquatilis]|uniref:semialdehyde dehydrogenase n=1 Tax=Deinococcus aquatilis TaxID=519440 RepID=UPI001B7FB32F|nr:semialdehyde dehydrogenase [Deinococcus aquatilis]
MSEESLTAEHIPALTGSSYAARTRMSQLSHAQSITLRMWHGSARRLQGDAMRTKFAFLLHPRDTLRDDLRQLLHPAFGLIPDRVLQGALQHLPLPPLITGGIRYDDAPDQQAGWLITVPLSASQLLRLPRAHVHGKINQAVDRARDLGASVVGLGALTAPATLGGQVLQERRDIGVTNGNAFTAAMTHLAVERLLPSLPAHPTIALVGATGSVGSCLTHLLAARTDAALMLIARHQGRLDALAADVSRPGLRVTTSTRMDDVRAADLVVLLTSAAEALLRDEHLRPGAIVLDDTQPRNTDASLLRTRPDVTIIDGGLVQVPGMQLRGTIGLASKVAYACLAETMLLTLDGHEGHFSIGAPGAHKAAHMLDLAARYAHLGFHLAPFRSFGRLLPDGALGSAPRPRLLERA